MVPYLTYGSKVALHSEFLQHPDVTGAHVGILGTGSLLNKELKVEEASQGIPQHFERFVFRILPVDLFRTKSTRENKSSKEPQVIKYGEMVQLQHCYTATFVCMNKRSPTEYDEKALKVSLVEGGDIKDITFRVMPRYKFRTEGEPIRQNENICFKMDSIEPRHLNWSKDPGIDGRWLVNCGSHQHAWTVVNYDANSDSQYTGGLRSGEAILLLSKDLHAYLGARAMGLIQTAAGNRYMGISNARTNHDKNFSAAASYILHPDPSNVPMSARAHAQAWNTTHAQETQLQIMTSEAEEQVSARGRTNTPKSTRFSDAVEITSSAEDPPSSRRAKNSKTSSGSVTSSQEMTPTQGKGSQTSEARQQKWFDKEFEHTLERYQSIRQSPGDEQHNITRPMSQPKRNSVRRAVSSGSELGNSWKEEEPPRSHTSPNFSELAPTRAFTEFQATPKGQKAPNPLTPSPPQLVTLNPTPSPEKEDSDSPDSDENKDEEEDGPLCFRREISTSISTPMYPTKHASEEPVHLDSGPDSTKGEEENLSLSINLSISPSDSPRMPGSNRAGSERCLKGKAASPPTEVSQSSPSMLGPPPSQGDFPILQLQDVPFLNLKLPLEKEAAASDSTSRRTKARQGSSMRSPSPNSLSTYGSAYSYSSLKNYNSTYITGKMYDFVNGLKKSEETSQNPGVVYLMQAAYGGSDEGIWQLSSNCLFMIEEEMPSKAGPIHYGSVYRLKHIATSSYLCVGTATATSEENELRGDDEEAVHFFGLSVNFDSYETLFMIQSVNAPISGNSYSEVLTLKEPHIRLRHLATGLFLNIPQTDKESIFNESKLYHQLELQSKWLYQDVLACVRPPPSLLKSLQFVLWVVRPIEEYVDHFQAQDYPIGSEMLNGVIVGATGALQDLIGFLSSDCTESKTGGMPVKANQKLLLDQNVHKIVMEMIRAPFHPPQGAPPQATAMMTFAQAQGTSVHWTTSLGYKLLKLMVKGNATFAMALSEFIPSMQQHIGCSVAVEETLMEIFKDNMELLEQLNEDILMCFGKLQNSRKGKQARYLNFLSELCSCNGLGIAKSQDMISKCIIQDSQETPIYLSWDTSSDTVSIMVPSTTVFEDDNALMSARADMHRTKKKDRMRRQGSMCEKKTSAAKLESSNMDRADSSLSGSGKDKKKREGTDLGSKGVNLAKSNWKSLHKSLTPVFTVNRFKKREEKAEVERDTYIPLHKFCDEAPAHILKYVEATLHLYSSICRGNNLKTKIMIGEIISRNMLAAVLGTQQESLKPLPATIIAKFYDIATHVYIESHYDNATALGIRGTIIPWASFDYESEDVDGFAYASGDSSKECHKSWLAILKTASLHLLSQHIRQVWDNVEDSTVVRSVLQMWLCLVRNRQITPKETVHLLKYLLPMLDVSNDIKDSTRMPQNKKGAGKSQSFIGTPKTFGESQPISGRMDPGQSYLTKKDDHEDFGVLEDTEKHALVIQCKRTICSIISAIMDRRVEKSCSQLVGVFVRLMKETRDHPQEEDSAMDMLKLVTEFLTTETARNNAIAAELKNYKYGETYLPRILCKYTSYSNEELLSDAMSLLVRLYSFKFEVVSLLQEVQILFNRHGQDQYHMALEHAIQLQTLVRCYPDALSSLIEPSKKAPDGRSKSPSQGPSVKCASAGLFLNVTTVKKKRRLSMNVGDDLLTHLDFFTSLINSACCRVVTGMKELDAVEPISGSRLDTSLGYEMSANLQVEYQNMLRTIGLHKIVLDVLKNLPEERGTVYHTASYRLLRLFVEGNSVNQGVLLTSGALQIAKVHSHLNRGSKELICEIYEGNHQLCAKVPDSLMEMFTNIALRSCDGDETAYKLRLLAFKFLKSVTVVNQLPLTRNQSIVMSYLSDKITDCQKTGRWTWDDVDGLMDERTQELVTEIVDLMLYCCTGLNSSTELQAQKILTPGVVIDILTEADEPLPLGMQIPFFGYLSEVAFVKEDDISNSDHLDERMWKLIETILRVMVQYNQTIDPDDLDEPMEAYNHYIFKGAIPCLTFFFKMYSDVGGVIDEWLDEHDSASDNGSDHNMNDSQVRCIKKFIVQIVRIFLNHHKITQIKPEQYEGLQRFFITVRKLEVLNDKWINTQCHDIDRAWTAHLKSQRDFELPQEERGFAFFDRVIAQLIRTQELCRVTYRQTHEVDDMDEFVGEMIENLIDAPWGKQGMKQIIREMRKGMLVTKAMSVALQFFRTYLEKQFNSKDKLLEVQLKFEQWGASALITTLVERFVDEDIDIAMAAIDFGIALFWGGADVVQDSLLAHLSSERTLFFISIQKLLDEGQNALQERKREKAFLKGNDDWMIDETQRKIYEEMLNNKRELYNAQKILRLLQLFCEGHHLEMQNTIRSCGLLEGVLNFLKHVITPDMDEVLVDLAIQAFNTLTEFCQGPCPLNQQALVQRNVGHEANQVLAQHICNSKRVLELRSAAVLTILSLLEGCNEKDRMGLMLQTMDFDCIRQTLDLVWQDIKDVYQGSSLSADQEEVLDLAFNLFILMYILQTSTGCEDLAGIMKSCQGYNNYIDMLGVIEIARGGDVETVYFRKPTICNALSRECKQEVLLEVDRSSPAAKVANFFERASTLIFEMEYRARMHVVLTGALPETKNMHLLKIRQFLLDKVQYRNRVGSSSAFAGACIINIIVGVTHKPLALAPRTDYAFHTEIFSPLVVGLMVDICGIFVLLSCLLALASLVFLELAVVLHSHQLLPHRDVIDAVLFTDQFSFSLWASMFTHLSWREVYEKVAGKIQMVYLYYAILVIASIMGLIHSPLWFSLHLLIIVDKSTILQNVIRSVTLNSKSLLLTALLGIIIIYLFTVTGFVFFPYDWVDGDGNAQCNSMTECLLFSLTHGIRSGGGIADLLKRVEFSDNHYTRRTLYDSAFHIFVIIILLNIVFGIIIDTFAELRDEKRFIDEDTKKRCFICGIEAYTFDRYAEGGFIVHTHKSHNMWQYLYFMHHLRRKPADDYTGQESYVFSRMQKQDMSFFPLNKSLDLKDLDILEGQDAVGNAAETQKSSSNSILDPRASANGPQVEELLGSLHTKIVEMEDNNQKQSTRLQNMEDTITAYQEYGEVTLQIVEQMQEQLAALAKRLEGGKSPRSQPVADTVSPTSISMTQQGSPSNLEIAIPQLDHQGSNLSAYGGGRQRGGSFSMMPSRQSSKLWAPGIQSARSRSPSAVFRDGALLRPSDYGAAVARMSTDGPPSARGEELMKNSSKTWREPVSNEVLVPQLTTSFHGHEDNAASGSTGSS